MHTASQWQHDEGGHAVAGSHRQHVAGVPQAVEAQRTAMWQACTTWQKHCARLQSVCVEP
jgi:hypothetical protein